MKQRQIQSQNKVPGVSSFVYPVVITSYEVGEIMTCMKFSNTIDVLYSI